MQPLVCRYPWILVGRAVAEITLQSEQLQRGRYDESSYRSGKVGHRAAAYRSRRWVSSSWTVACRYSGLGGIDDPDCRLNGLRDHLSGMVATSGHELSGDESDEFRGRKLRHTDGPFHEQLMTIGLTP
jgi:hypothetical protein